MTPNNVDPLDMLKLATVTVSDSIDFEEELRNHRLLSRFATSKKVDEYDGISKIDIHGTTKSRKHLAGLITTIEENYKTKIHVELTENPVGRKPKDLIEHINQLEACIISSNQNGDESESRETEHRQDLLLNQIFTEIIKNPSNNPDSITAQQGDGYLIQGLKDIELPRLEEYSKSYDTLMANKTPLSENDTYTSLISSKTEIKSSLNLLSQDGNVDAKTISSLEETIRNITTQITDMETQYKKDSKIFARTNIHYLITRSETSDENGDYYVISVTTPIRYKSGDEVHKKLEITLLSHIQTEWNKLREKIKGDFETVDNMGLMQYDFRIQKSGISVEKIKDIQKELGDALYNTQTGYMFSQLGLRLDIRSVDNTDGQALSVDALVGQEYVPEPVNHSSRRKEIPYEIRKEYSVLATEAREQGILIEDDPTCISSSIYNPNDLPIIPAILLAAADGGASKGQMREYLCSILPGIEEEQMNTKLTDKLTLLRRKGMIESQNRIWKINPDYMSNQNG